MLKSMRDGYGDALVELENENIVVLDADLAHATMSSIFLSKYPERFFNLGIAEQNLFGVATGMAHSGLTVFAGTFAMFATGRAYEQVRNSVCYSNANVKVVGTHAGLSPCSDGGSHQTIEDIALMRVLPNMTVFSPCDYNQTKQLVKEAAKIKGPVYIRLGRMPSPMFTQGNIEVGKAQILREGNDICLISTGVMVWKCLQAAEELQKKGIEASVINVHTMKPFDEDTILKYAKHCHRVVTVEEHSIIGGLGSIVAETLLGKGDFCFKRIGIDDKFGQSGDFEELMEFYGLTKENIISTCEKMMMDQ